MSIIPTNLLTGTLIYPTPVTLTAANGQSISCAGQTTVDINIQSLRRTNNRAFIAADVTSPLLGFDFLKNFELLVDCNKRQLIDCTTGRVATVQTRNKFHTHKRSANK